MDINQIYIAVENDIGFKLVKADKFFDMDNFTIINSGNGQYYLERKLEYKKISPEKIGKYNFTNCKICKCTINNVIYNLSSLNKILIQIFKIINNKELIVKNTKLSLIELTNKTKQFETIKKLDLSYMKPENNMAIDEIITQCQINNIKLDLKIILFNQLLVRIKL